MMPNLLSLAPELVYGIAEMANRKDVEQLRLTCKYLGDILESYVLHTIHFSVHHHNYKKATARLQSLATSKNFLQGLSRSVRHLHIGPLSAKPFSSMKSYSYVDDELVPIPDPEDGPGVVVEKLMRTYLCDALDALRSLQFVTWTPGKKDEVWTHEIIKDFLISRPSLHTLKVELSYLRIAVPLDQMQDLREITFTERYGYRSSQPVRVQTYNNLAKFFASCPAGQITKLSIVLTSLHEIFQFLTPEIEPLRLKDIRMVQSFIKLDAFTISHLRHLTCLHLLSMKTPSNLRSKNSDSSKDTSPESSGALENAECRIGSKLSDLWSALHLAGIYLKEIQVDVINTGLLGYLTRYTGLTKLIISTRCFNSLPESDASAKLFFAEPLASHFDTLAELTGFEDLWCFGEHNLSAFSSCRGLDKLSVSVAKADLNVSSSRGDTNVGPAQNESDVVKKLLDMASSHMPRLSQLSILPSSEERFRGARRQGTRSFIHQKAVAQLAIECLLAYPIPPSPTIVRLPSVLIWSRIFEPNFASLLLDGILGKERRRRYQEIKECVNE